MPRARIAARLQCVEEQIRLAESEIGAQRAVIEELRRKGYAIGAAETHLTILAAGLVSHRAERDRLLAELSALPPG